MAKEESGKAEAAKGKKKSKLMMFLIPGLVVLLGGGFLGWKMMGKGGSAERTAPKKEAHASSGEGEESAAKEGATISFDPFLVNLADKENNRYLKTTIRILISEKEVATKISAGDVLVPRMRDTILGILSTKESGEITNNEGKQKLKKEILEKINEFLPDKCAKDVFFTDFVVQL